MGGGWIQRKRSRSCFADEGPVINVTDRPKADHDHVVYIITKLIF